MRLVTVVFDSRSHYADLPRLTISEATSAEKVKTIIANKVGAAMARKREKPGWHIHLEGMKGEIRDRHAKPLISFRIEQGISL